MRHIQSYGRIPTGIQPVLHWKCSFAHWTTESLPKIFKSVLCGTERVFKAPIIACSSLEIMRDHSTITFDKGSSGSG